MNSDNNPPATRQISQQQGNAKFIAIGVVAVLVIGIILYLTLGSNENQQPVITEINQQPIAQPESQSEPVELPEPAPVASDEVLISESLPALDSSDETVKRLVNKHLSSQSERLMEDSSLLQKIVLQIDNMAQGKIIYRHSPISAPNELFSVTQVGDKAYMSEASKNRFNVYADALATMDMEKLVAVYQYFKPLLEEAYAELGYQSQDFESKLKVAIDHVLAAPDAASNLALIRPTVAFHFSERRYERMSMVHKQMIRMGTANASKIRAVLKDFKQRL